MTLFELSVPTLAPAFRVERPFVYSCAPGVWETADFWTDIFGAPREESSEAMHINSFFRDGINRYSPVSSMLSLLATERSFYWAIEQGFVYDGGVLVTDDGNPLIDAVSSQPRLYIHIEHDQLIFGPVWQYGKTHGFCKERALYIDDIFYSPVLDSIPSLAQDQDLEVYDALAFISGAVTLKSHTGDLDWMLTTPPFGFECFLARLPARKGVDEYTRSELTYLAALYVEDYRASLAKTTLNLQDRRKAQNIKVPTETFADAEYPDIEDGNIDKPIPLLFGTVRAVKPILVNGEDDVSALQYRVAQSLTALGTVQVKVDDDWTTVTPASIDLATGSFTLSDADGRSDAGSPYECRVLNPANTAQANPIDIIAYLNARYLGAQETSDDYDATEWAAAKAALEDIGLYIDSQTELYEIIRKLQGGSNVGFRYEFKPSGARTARIDDWERASSFRIHREDIADIEDVEIETDSDLLAATVKILYAHDYAENEDLEYLDDTEKTAVQLAYRQEPQLEFETLLQTKEHAAACAALKVAKYSKARMVVSLTALGSDYLALRIYDVGAVELLPGGYDADLAEALGTRLWAGVWQAIVLSVDPDISQETNTIRLALIKNVTDVYPLVVESDGAEYYLTDEAGAPIYTR
jgi:hypothetical protein